MAGNFPAEIFRKITVIFMEISIGIFPEISPTLNPS